MHLRIVTRRAERYFYVLSLKILSDPGVSSGL